MLHKIYSCPEQVEPHVRSAMRMGPELVSCAYGATRRNVTGALCGIPARATQGQLPAVITGLGAQRSIGCEHMVLYEILQDFRLHACPREPRTALATDSFKLYSLTAVLMASVAACHRPCFACTQAELYIAALASSLSGLIPIAFWYSCSASS